MNGVLVIHYTCGRCGHETSSSTVMPFSQTLALPHRLTCGKCKATVNYSRLQEEIFDEVARKGGEGRLSHQLSFECPRCGKWSKCVKYRVGVDDVSGYDNLIVPETIGCEMCEEVVRVPKSEGV